MIVSGGEVGEGCKEGSAHCFVGKLNTVFIVLYRTCHIAYSLNTDSFVPRNVSITLNL